MSNLITSIGGCTAAVAELGWIMSVRLRLMRPVMALMIGVLALHPGGTSAVSALDAREIALEAVAKLLGSDPAEVAIAAEGAVNPWGAEPGFYHIKAYDALYEKVEYVWVDLGSGLVLDRTGVEQATRAQRDAIGKFTSSLRDPAS